MDNNNRTNQTLADDVSYLRGRYDSDIPTIMKGMASIVETLEGHSKKIGNLEIKDESTKTKVSLIAAVAGITASGIVTWIVRHF